MDETAPPLMSLLKYGKRVGWTRGQSYAAAREKVIPIVNVGSLIFVPVAQADRKLGLSPDTSHPEQQAAA